MDPGKGLWTALLLAIAGAVVAGVFSLMTTRENARLEREKLALQEKLGRDQEEIEREKIQRQNAIDQDKLAVENKRSYAQVLREHDAREAAIRSNPNGSWFHINARNSCTEGIYLAVKYRALDDDWISAGWFRVSAGEDSGIGYTNNRKVYYRATSPRYRWEGEESLEGVEQDAFRILDGEMFPGPKATLKARRFDITGDSREVFIPFVCNP